MKPDFKVPLNRELCEKAVAIPSLDAAAALEVLADHLLERGFTTGLVTSEEHDRDRARRRFLGYVFLRARTELEPRHQCSMRYRISGPLEEDHCWVRFPFDPGSLKLAGWWRADYRSGFFDGRVLAAGTGVFDEEALVVALGGSVTV